MNAGEGHDPIRAQRTVRDRAAVLVAVFAVLLAIIHLAGASAQRRSMLASIEASDNFAYLEAKVVRETVLLTASRMPGLETETRGNELGEAVRLRQPDDNGHSIDQLQQTGDQLRRESNAEAAAAAGYELGETALQVALVLLSIAMITQSARMLAAACALAGCGVLLAVLTAVGLLF